jgi:hypothetical protein
VATPAAAGEALSAAWLTATELAVSVVPMSATIESATGREKLRRLLGGVGYPYLVLCLARHIGLEAHARCPCSLVIGKKKCWHRLSPNRRAEAGCRTS